MKIHSDNPISGISVYKRKVEEAQKKTAISKTVNGDSIEFSSLSQELAKIGNEVLSPGDVRKEKVNSLKKQIETGEYKIDVEALAEKIVSDFALDFSDKK